MNKWVDWVDAFKNVSENMRSSTLSDVGQAHNKEMVLPYRGNSYLFCRNRSSSNLFEQVFGLQQHQLIPLLESWLWKGIVLKVGDKTVITQIAALGTF